MPKPPKRNLKAEDVQDNQLTEQEILDKEAELEMLAAEAEALAPPAEIDQLITEAAVCRYAGDPEDQNCAVCDGVIYDEGAAYETCKGYDDSAPPPDDWEAYYATSDEPAEVTVTELPPAQEKHTKEPLTKKVTTGTMNSQTLEIRAESAVTKEVTSSTNEKVWIKAGYSEMRTLNEGLTGEEVQKEIDELWDCVSAELDQQIIALEDQYLV